MIYTNTAPTPLLSQLLPFVPLPPPPPFLCLSICPMEVQQIHVIKFIVNSEYLIQKNSFSPEE